MKELDIQPCVRILDCTKVLVNLDNDFDSSFDARRDYYEALGGEGKYTGSAEQNIYLLEQMDEKGYTAVPKYKKDVRHLPEDQIAITQEDGDAYAPPVTENTIPVIHKILESLQKNTGRIGIPTGKNISSEN